MVADGGSLRSRLLGGAQQTDERMVGALESTLEGTERVVHRLTSGRGVVRKRNGDTQKQQSGDGGTLLAVTDRKLVLVIDVGSDVETARIPYTDLKRIETDKGFLRTHVALSIWGRGMLRFKPAKSADIEEAVSFASTARGVWQRAVAALQDAREHIEKLPDLIAAGDTDAAEDRRAAAQDKIGMARQQAASAPDPAGRAISERVSSVQRELARTRMEAHLERGRTIAPATEEFAKAGNYDEAYETLSRARSHLTTAHRIALDEEFQKVDTIRSARTTLDDHIDRLAAIPVERAEAALDRLQRTSGPHRKLIACEHALVCYRDALTAGWGHDAFEGDTDALRMQIEWLVGRIVELRRQFAERAEAEGDTYEGLGLERVALDRYETACAHLLAAERLAVQYRTGNVSTLREAACRVVGKLEA